GINLGQHNVTAYNVTMLLQRVALLTFLALIAMSGGLNLPRVLAAWIGAVGSSLLVGGGWVWWHADCASVSGYIVFRGWGRSLLRGFRALLTISLTLVLIRADVYMLGPMLGMEAVGQISVASTFTEYLWYVPSILGSVLFAAVASDRGAETV